LRRFAPILFLWEARPLADSSHSSGPLGRRKEGNIWGFKDWLESGGTAPIGSIRGQSPQAAIQSAGYPPALLCPPIPGVFCGFDTVEKS